MINVIFIIDSIFVKVVPVFFGRKFTFNWFLAFFAIMCFKLSSISLVTDWRWRNEFSCFIQFFCKVFGRSSYFGKVFGIRCISIVIVRNKMGMEFFADAGNDRS